MHGPDPIDLVRIVAHPDAIDGAIWPPESLPLRTAPDEVLLIRGQAPILDDPAAIVIDDGGWSVIRLDNQEANAILDHTCSWQRPVERPLFAQGMVAQLPVKIWFGNRGVLFIVSHPLAAELESRIRPWATR